MFCSINTGWSKPYTAYGPNLSIKIHNNKWILDVHTLRALQFPGTSIKGHQQKRKVEEGQIITKKVSITLCEIFDTLLIGQAWQRYYKGINCLISVWKLSIKSMGSKYNTCDQQICLKSLYQDKDKVVQSYLFSTFTPNGGSPSLP